MIKGLSPTELRRLILSVGTHHSTRLLSPVEVAVLVQKALDAGEKPEEIARALQLGGPTMVIRFTRLLHLPQDIQPLIGWRSDSSTISFTTASELARVQSIDESRILSAAVIEHQLTSSEVKQVVQIFKRSGKSISESIEDVIKQRPTVERRHIIIGGLLSDTLKERLIPMSQFERNEMLRHALENIKGKEFAVLGAKLGLDNFILVGNEQLQAALKSLPGGFEQAITDYLLLELQRNE